VVFILPWLGKPTVELLADSMDLSGRSPEFFYGCFLTVCEILAENSAIVRRALQTELVRRLSQEHTGQHCETGATR
jgi:hypothetical protein